MTTPAVRRVSVRRGQQFTAYDMTSGDPCPARYEVEDARAGRVWLLVEVGIGIKICDRVAMLRPDIEDCRNAG